MEAGGKRVHLRKKSAENRLLAISLWRLAKKPWRLLGTSGLAKCQEPKAES
jgi:hypothetical protein